MDGYGWRGQWLFDEDDDEGFYSFVTWLKPTGITAAENKSPAELYGWDLHMVVYFLWTTRQEFYFEEILLCVQAAAEGLKTRFSIILSGSIQSSWKISARAVNILDLQMVTASYNMDASPYLTSLCLLY